MRRTRRRDSPNRAAGMGSIGRRGTKRRGAATRGQGLMAAKRGVPYERKTGGAGGESPPKEASDARVRGEVRGPSSRSAHSPNRQPALEGGRAGEKPKKKGAEAAQMASPMPWRPTRNRRRTSPRGRLGRVSFLPGGAGRGPSAMRSVGPGGERGSRRISNSSASPGGGSQPRATVWPGGYRRRAGTRCRRAAGPSGAAGVPVPAAKGGRGRRKIPARSTPHWRCRLPRRQAVIWRNPLPGSSRGGAGVSPGPRT